MKKIKNLFLCLSLLLALPLQAAIFTDTLSVLGQQLQSLPGISDVTSLQTTQKGEKYQLFIDQPLDMTQPAAGNFRQRIIV